MLQCIGPSYDGFAYLPALATRGGIFIAWDSTRVNLSNFVNDTNFITGYVLPREGNAWWLTVVYGPQEDAQKVMFLKELAERHSYCHGPWLVIGDFNIILHAADKNNSRIDRRMMGKFKKFVDDNALKELFLHGRKYTWSNDRERPTLTKIDRAFASVDWEMDHPESLLQALSTSHSDHCPLYLSLEEHLQSKRRFRFVLFWTKMEGFLDMVKEAWMCEEEITDPFIRLDVLLRNTARHLTAWGQKKVGNIKMQIAVANAVILRFDVAQEQRLLSEEERWLRKTLKHMVLGLASLERTIARQ